MLGVRFTVMTHRRLVAVQRLRVLRHLDERPDGVVAGAGRAGLDQEADEIVVGLGRGQRDADPGRGDVLGREQSVRGGLDALGRLAVPRHHRAARQRRCPGLVTVGRPVRWQQQANGRQNDGGDRGRRRHIAGGVGRLLQKDESKMKY